MQVSSASGVKVYDLSQAKSAAIANNLSKNNNTKKRARTYTNNKIDLLQDFAFPSYSRCVRFSRDGRFILTSGGYKPRIKMYDVQDLSLKFERFCDSDIEDLEILSEDYSKFVLMSENRTLEFHTKFGVHEIVKIPQNGRSLAFDSETSDLYVATNTNLLHRFNLTEGRFRTPLVLDGGSTNTGGANCVRWNANHRLIAAAGEDGTLSLFDPRTKLRAAALQVNAGGGGGDNDARALTVVEYMDHTGLNLGVGDAGGKVSLFDLRSSRPWKQKQHMYETKIQSLCFTNSGGDEPVRCISLDSKQIKGWSVDSDNDQSAGFNFNLESASAGEMSRLCLAPQSSQVKNGKTSGLLMASGNCTEAIQMFFVPSLGPAPVWARYLESVTEELEIGGGSGGKSSSGASSAADAFDNFRFVTKAELEDMNMSSLIGSKELKPWMHGYFMEATAFEKLRQVMTAPSHVGKKTAAAPGAAGASKKKDKEEQRIQLQRRVRVNASLAERLPGDVLTDDRFKNMFSDPEFTVNESSAEFRLKHPNRYREPAAADAAAADGGAAKDAAAAARFVKPQADRRSSSSSSSLLMRKAMSETGSSRSGGGGGSVGKSFLDAEPVSRRAGAADDDDGNKRASSRRRGEPQDESLGRRLAKEEHNKVTTTRGKAGEMSITFVPKDDADGGKRPKPRRGRAAAREDDDD